MIGRAYVLYRFADVHDVYAGFCMVDVMLSNFSSFLCYLACCLKIHCVQFFILHFLVGLTDMNY